MKSIDVRSPEVSQEELDTALRLGLASFQTCRGVCRENGLGLNVAISALAIALVKCAQEYGMGQEGLINVVRTMSDTGVKPGN